MKKTIILFCIILFSCSPGKETVTDIEVLDFRDRTFDFTRAKITQIIPLETREDNLLGDIRQAEVFDNRIFVIEPLKSKTLQVYDLSGKYIGKIGKRGQGPGEYEKPTAFIIDKENRMITIVDNLRNFFHRYDLDSYEYLSSKKIPFNFAHCLLSSAESYTWYFSMGFKNKEDGNTYHFMTTDTALNNRQYFHPTEFISAYGLGAGENIYKVEQDLFGFVAFKNLVYRLETDTLIPTYQIVFDKSRLPTLEELNNLSNNGETDYAMKLYNSDLVSMYAVDETPSCLYLTYFINTQCHIGLYHKKTKQIEKTTMKEFGEEWAGISYNPIGVSGDSFIFSIDPGRLKRGFPNRPELKALQSQCQEEDNPILCLINFTAE